MSKDEKICSQCGQKLVISMFSPHSHYKDGFYYCCKDCAAKYQREYQKDYDQYGKAKQRIERRIMEAQQILLSQLEKDLEQRTDFYADLEHKRWSRWQAHCHKVLRELCPSLELEKVLERWDRQIATDFADLTDREKDMDRKEVQDYVGDFKILINKYRER